MATDLCTSDRTVVHFAPRRSPRSLVAPDHGSAELLQFPARANADAWHRSRQAGNRHERQSADDPPNCPTGLLEAVMQTNVQTVQAMVRLTSPAGWIELQQRAAQEYVAVMMIASLALVRAMTGVATQPADGRSIQALDVQLSQTRG
jgi:hypothetical protein